jgi:hypothetical protein
MPKQLFQRPAPIKKSKMGKHNSGAFGQGIPTLKNKKVAKADIKEKEAKDS